MASCTCLWQKPIKLFKNQFRIKSVITNANQHSRKQRNCLLEQSGLVGAMYDFNLFLRKFVISLIWVSDSTVTIWSYKNPTCLKINPESNTFKDAWSYANIIPRWTHTMIFLCQIKIIIQAREATFSAVSY